METIFANLLPTAACFRSDLHIKPTVMAIAIPQRRIEPNSFFSESSTEEVIRLPTQILQMPAVAERDTIE